MADRQQHQDSENEYINKWVAEGLYTQDAILSRWSMLWDEVELRMASLASDCPNKERLSESAFIAHLQKQDRLFESEDGREASKIVFSSIRYLAKLPLISKPSHPDGLTGQELSVAATWLFFTHTIDLGEEARTRTLADYRRILFQSLAVFDDQLVHDHDDWYRYALESAVADLDPDDIRDQSCNRDEDGDELYHDVVDVLFRIQPERWGKGLMVRVHRDYWRVLAKRLHDTNVRLHQLSIPFERFRILVQALLPAQWEFESRPVPQRAGAESSDAAECITRAFGQNREGITWPTFNNALKNAAPHLLNPMLRILSNILLGEVGAGTDMWYTIEDDPMEMPPAGIIASPAILGQLGTIFSAQRIFEFKCTEHWAGADKPSAATLFTKLTQSLQEKRSAILLIVGEDVAGGGKCIFGASKGVVSKWLQSKFDKGTSVIDLLMPIPAKLFQLYPVQDVFSEGDFAFVDGSLRFDGSNSPAFMSLEPALGGGCVNAGREAAGSRALDLSKWRQRGLIQFRIQEVEMWEHFEYTDDE